MYKKPTLEQILERNNGLLIRAVTTKEASKIIGVPKESLTTMRSRGGGPKFLQPKGTRIIRYFVIHLFEWVTSGGIKSNTADEGVPCNIPSPPLPCNDNFIKPKKGRNE